MCCICKISSFVKLNFFHVRRIKKLNHLTISLLMIWVHQNFCYSHWCYYLFFDMFYFKKVRKYIYKIRLSLLMKLYFLFHFEFDGICFLFFVFCFFNLILLQNLIDVICINHDIFSKLDVICVIIC